MIDDIPAHISSQAFVQETMSKVDSTLFLEVCNVNLIQVRPLLLLHQCCLHPKATLDSKQI